MSRFNWIGFAMLILAVLFPVSFPGEMELLLGIDTWNDMWNDTWYEMNTGAVIAAVIYLLVGTTLALWPNVRDE
jgi:hypothetical protein